MSDYEILYARIKRGLLYFVIILLLMYPLLDVFSILTTLFHNPYKIYMKEAKNTVISSYEDAYGSTMNGIIKNFKYNEYDSNFMYTMTQEGDEDFSLYDSYHFLFNKPIVESGSRCIGLSFNPEEVFPSLGYSPLDVAFLKKIWGKNPVFIHEGGKYYYEYQKEDMIIRFYANSDGDLIAGEYNLIIDPKYVNDYVGEKDYKDLSELYADTKDSAVWATLPQYLKLMHRPISEITESCEKEGNEEDNSASFKAYYIDTKNDFKYCIEHMESCTSVTVPAATFFNISDGKKLTRADVERELGKGYTWGSEGLMGENVPCYIFDLKGGLGVFISSDLAGNIKSDDLVKIEDDSQ